MASSKNTFWKFSNTFGPFLGLFVVIGLFSIKPEVREVFLSVYNFKVIFSQTVIVAICALGMTLIIISGGIDLSVGSVIALTSVVGALGIQSGYPMPVVCCMTILAGVMVGLVNGGIVSAFKMAPFIVTLGMMGIARGVAKLLADNQTVNFSSSSVISLMRDPDPLTWLPPMGVWIAIGLAIVVAVVMRQTIFGRYIFAMGSNEDTARLCGIRVRTMKVVIYGLSGLFFGIAGIMQLSRLRQGDPTAAIGAELDVIAAVVIGGASLNGGTGSVLGSMIGALIMAVLRNGSQQMGWSNAAQDIIIGAVIILAVGLDRLRQKSASK